MVFAGSWEARIGAGTNHHLYLGTYKEEESAARHYDQALVRLKGESGTTNFPIDKYQDQVKEHEEVEKVNYNMEIFHSLKDQ